MVCIRTRFRDDIHLRAKRVSRLRRVATVGVVNLLHAIYAGARDTRRFLTFSIEKSVDVAAHGALAVQGNVQARKNVLQTVNAALEKSGRIHRTGSDFQKLTYITAVDRQVRYLIGV